MLLGNTHVVVAIREALFKLHQARAFTHGGRNTHQTLVLRCRVTQPFAEHLGERGLGGRAGFDNSYGRVELAGAVVGNRVSFCQLVAMTFLGDYVQELWAFQTADVFQRGDQRIQIMAINGADVVKAKVLEQRRRHHHALGTLLQALGQFQQRRHLAEHVLAHVARHGVELTAHELGQIAVERTHGWADAHVIVIEDDQQIAIHDPGIVQGLKSHACRHGAIANHGNRTAVFALALGRHGHAQCRRNTGRGVPDPKGVVLAFRAQRKA